MTDISRSGCFVLSGGRVQVKELIWLEIQLPDRDPIHFWAEVVNEASEIGFALRFNSASDGDDEVLAKFLEGVFAGAQKKA